MSTEDLVTIVQNIKDCESETSSNLFLKCQDDLFTYLRYWMKTGIVTPRLTSKLERLMREINRRIKKFAFNRERCCDHDEVNSQTHLFAKRMG